MKSPVEDHRFMYCADPEKATALFCVLLMEECGGDAGICT